MTSAATRSQVTFSTSSYTSSGMNSAVATAAKYSPHRLSSHSPVPSSNCSSP